jgi:mevalonate kinase
MGVSSPELDRLVGAALGAGASGAKLSGGGMGGHMIAVVTPDRARAITAALLEAGAARAFATQVGP